MTRGSTSWPCLALVVACLPIGGLAAGTGADGEVAYLAHVDGYWQAWAMAADGKAQLQITRSPYDKNRVSWYPDGRHLLVNGTQGSLARVDIVNGDEAEVSVGLMGMNDAVLSPDGRHIAFSLSTAGSIDNNKIWIVTADGKDLRRRTDMRGLQHEPAWGPDGRWIYFLSGEGGQVHDIWRMSVSGERREQLTAGPLYQFDVAVSARGDLAFSSNRTGNYEIWVQRASGERIQITDHPALDARPTWSPDGNTLIFESTRERGIPNLWKVDIDTRKAARLTAHNNGARAPVWRSTK